MTTDDFTEAARAEAEDYARTPRMNVGTVRDRIAVAYMAGAEWARDYIAARTPQVTIVRDEGKPAACEVRQGGVPIFLGLDWSAGPRVATQELTDAEKDAAMDALGCELRLVENGQSTCDLHGGYATSDDVCEVVEVALSAARAARRDEEKR